jgi:hypothetical protein
MTRGVSFARARQGFRPDDRRHDHHGGELCLVLPAVPRVHQAHALDVDRRGEGDAGRRIATLLSSRSHSTELPTAAHCSQSAALKLTVEKACWRTGM